MAGSPPKPAGALVPVEDPADPRLADYRDLNDAELRRRRGADDAVVVVEGRLAVAQLMGSTYEVCSLLVDDHQVDALADLVAAVRARGAPVYVGRRPVVAATVGFALHRGVVATARRPPPADPHQVLTTALRHKSVGDGPPVVVVLEGLNDHENLGALFRNAAAFGAGAVLLSPTCADPLYRRTVRVSLGLVSRVPFGRAGSWPEDLDEVRRRGYELVALTPAATAPPIVEVATGVGRRPVALVVGAEGPGLSSGVLERCRQARIPMAPGVDSLNVAAATAVALFCFAGRA